MITEVLPPRAILTNCANTLQQINSPYASLTPSAAFLRKQTETPQDAAMTAVFLAVRLAVCGESFLHSPELRPANAPHASALVEPGWRLADSLSRSLAQSHAMTTLSDILDYLGQRASEPTPCVVTPATPQAYFERWCEGFCMEMLAGHTPLPEIVLTYLQDDKLGANRQDALCTILARYATKDSEMPKTWHKGVPGSEVEHKAIFDQQIASFPDNYAKICALAVLSLMQDLPECRETLATIRTGARSSSCSTLLKAYDTFLPSMAVLTGAARQFMNPEK